MSNVNETIAKHTQAQDVLNNHGLDDHIERRHRDRVLTAAARYVASQNSDPFTGRRVAAHLRSGIGVQFDKEGNPQGYDAEKALETRRLKGVNGQIEEYKVEVYHNMQRP